MSGLAVANALVPWAVIIAFCGLIVKVRLSGDPALWKRVEALEAKLDQQAKDFERKLDDEKAECAKKIAALEGRIRQLQQRQSSLGNVAEDKPLGPQLRTAFPVRTEDKDADVLAKLSRVPGRRRK